MSRRFKPLPLLEGEQASAADPQAHAALSASAGTGKTQVLTARVLRLLLQGARPEAILCLTFTKAAAAEMANRIGARLASWVRLKDSQLALDLDHLGESNDPPTRERARRLFARVLDCPGGLKIQTIHSFAQSLLAAFPAEADIAPGFQPIEGRAEQELVRRTLAELLANAEAVGDDGLIRDVQCLSRRLGEAGAVDYLKACAARADSMAAFGDRDAIEPKLRTMLGLPDGDAETLVEERCRDDRFDCDLLHRLLEANRGWDTESGRTICANIEEWLAHTPEARTGGLQKLATKLVTREFRPHKVSPRQIAVCPDYEELVGRLALLLQEIEQLRQGLRLAGDIAAGLRAGQAFAAAYTHAKRSAGVADFNDLIDWTRRLLAKPGMGDWVRYKLDRRIDHILIDEAQDTNAAQWEIVQQLVEEFFTGSSEAEARWRTLFLVGDFKQAIYGFQGTDPNEFNTARGVFRARAEALIEAERSGGETLERRAREFRDLSIAASFRSAQPVLDVVDSVIGQLGHRALALPEPPPPHRAHHSDRAGQVELWPPHAVEEPDADGDEGEERWVDLRDRLYATELARRIKALLDEAPLLASTGSRLTPGDILVLVRSRGELASLLVARLFSAGIPVAGLDRLHLHEPLAVQDLLAAVRFAVQPGDDLSLACLLTSPLFGWDQDQLRTLAYGRKGTLWAELRGRTDESGLFKEAHDQLSELLRIADFVSPSQFLETILTGPMQGRRNLYLRLGLASRDPIDELMNSALEFERSETISLDRFLAWFTRGDVEVQRDAAQPANEVRVMTVHGAKGLEAPVVILADATADPAKLGRTPVAIEVDIRDDGKAPLLRPRKEERRSPFAELIADQEARALEEHWRLLYVAMTRAADRLIVSGVAPKKDRPLNCWHRAVEQGLLALGAEVREDGTLVHAGGAAPKAKPPKAVRVPIPVEIPRWAVERAPAEARPPRPLAPSAAAEDKEPAPPPSAGQRAAARRGTLIHQLLERLPEVRAESRHEAADAWLERSVGIRSADERAELAGLACSLIEHPEFSPLFGPGSLAEAPIAAALADGRVIAGTVDRLLVETNQVSVIDFKTGRVPAAADQVPAGHRAQMMAYVEALRAIFPDREVRAALLYTAGPALFEIAA